MGAPAKGIPKAIQALGDIELETKINLEKLDDVKMVVIISRVWVFKSYTSHRMALFFSNNLVAHNVLILVKDSNEVWIKIKEDKQQIYTPHSNFPILSKARKKIKPQDVECLWVSKTISQVYRFVQKECLDFLFYYKDLSFTTTLSLADSENSSTLSNRVLSLMGTKKEIHRLTLIRF